MGVVHQYIPQLSDVRFHKNDWELHEDNPDNKAWFTEKRAAARLQLARRAPTWPFDLCDIDGARVFFEDQSRGFQGAMIELEVVDIQGLEALVGVFKYRSPLPQYLGGYYVGIIWIPFQDFLFQINFEAFEQGTTGLREAAVAAIEEPPPAVTSEPTVINSTEELFEKLRSGTIRRLPSDDQRFDEMFPDHPLSNVRDLQQRFMCNVVFNSQLFDQQRYRLSH